MATRPDSRPRNPRHGFTLIELLIVVVIIGALASIAVPKFTRVRDRAARGSMISDLRNVAVAQEGYFFEWNSYAVNTDSLQFKGTSGVAVTIVEATDKGWSATATRTGVSGSTCSVYYGNATPIVAAVAAGEFHCE